MEETLLVSVIFTKKFRLLKSGEIKNFFDSHFFRGGGGGGQVTQVFALISSKVSPN